MEGAGTFLADDLASTSIFFLLFPLTHEGLWSYYYSKSGRPLKKLSERKGFSRLGHMASGGSPDCSGKT